MRTQVAGIPRRHPSCPSCQHKLFPTDCQNRFQLCLPRQFHSVHQPIGYLLLYTSLQLDCFLHNHVHKFYQWSNEVSNLPAVKHLKKQRAPKNAERQYIVIFLSTNLGSPRLTIVKCILASLFTTVSLQNITVVIVITHLHNVTYASLHCFGAP